MISCIRVRSDFASLEKLQLLKLIDVKVFEEYFNNHRDDKSFKLINLIDESCDCD